MVVVAIAVDVTVAIAMSSTMSASLVDIAVDVGAGWSGCRGWCSHESASVIMDTRGWGWGLVLPRAKDKLSSGSVSYSSSLSEMACSLGAGDGVAMRGWMRDG